MSIKYISIKIYLEEGRDKMIRLTIDKYIDNKRITRYELSKRTGIRFHIIDNYYKNKVVRYDSDVLDRICTALECDISDIIEYSNN